MFMTAPRKPTSLDPFRLFDTLTDGERHEISRKLISSQRLKGDILFLPMATSPVLYLIHQGQVKLSRYSADGREIILDFRQSGDVIGELGLLDWPQRDEVAEVIGDAHISTLLISDLQPLMGANASFSLQITQLVVQRLKRMQYRYESLCFQGASSRIKQFIREQADTIGRRVGTEIDVRITMTHQDIGKLTITSRQLVSGVLSELKRQNVISYNRNRILIRDYQALLR